MTSLKSLYRANSGGTKLGKSDLLFSLLISSWEDADGEMEELLEDLNQGNFGLIATLYSRPA